MTLTLRYMKTSDVKQVSAIDHLSFTPPWPTDSYNFEINQSTVSHMVVLEDCVPPDDQTAAPSNDRIWERIARWLNPETPAPDRVIVGYGGLWKIAEEAHISTIATHPDYRGNGYGEMLLAGMYGKALSLNAEYIVLEVRVSNHVAQRLYTKYGFTRHGVKERYYRSDNEDAYDMRVNFEDDIVGTYHDLYEQLQDKREFEDRYTNSPHPRRG